VKILFSGRTPSELTPQESAEVSQLMQGSTAMVVIVAIVVLVGVVAGIGIIAAIAIPSLLRARISANESGAIGRVRTVISAQIAYSQSANSGYADRPECLANASRCIPGYSGPPAFLDESISFTQPQSGYMLRFYAGPAAPADVLAQGRVSPSSVQTYAVIAAPVQPNQTGVRFFCGEMSGRICSMPSAPAPAALESGTCPANCQDLH
jgi:type IV pilus assembly protein PilA